MPIEKFIDPVAGVIVSSSVLGGVTAKTYGGIPISGSIPAGAGIGAGAAPGGILPTAAPAVIQPTQQTVPAAVVQQQPQVLPAVAAAAPVVAAQLPALLGALGIPAATAAGIGTAVAAGGAIYGGLQALGLGEGGGLFGNNLLGGDETYMSGIPFGGPGLAEPPAEWVLKEWHVNHDNFRLQYYLVQMPNGRRKIAMYHTGKKRWKVWNWSTPRLAVIGKNMPSHKMIVRLRKNIGKHRADADTILRLTSPKYSAYKARRRSRR